VRSLVRQLIGLAIPVAIARLGVVGMGVVDMTVVGQLAPPQLAHQALGWTIVGPALIGGIGLLLGVQVLTARAIGAGHPESVVDIWHRGLTIAGVVGFGIWVASATLVVPLLIAFGVAPDLAPAAGAVASVLALSIPFHLIFIASTNFLEALQRPTPGAIVMWGANAINLILNLAFVPSWGAIGSAWATVSSRLILAVAILTYIQVAPSLSAFRKPRTATQEFGYRALLAIGVAAAMSSIVEAGAFAALGVIAGRINATAVATFAIATGGLVTLAYLFAQGLATAGSILVAEASGSGANERVNRVAWSAVGLTACAMFACGAMCVVFAGPVARAFSADATVVASLTGVMALVAALMTPDGGQGVTDAVLRARGQNWFPTLVRTVPFVFVAPPLALWLSEHEALGITGVIEALLTASSLAYALLLARLAVASRRRRE
jgi:MATE family multidrug resistance protein